MPPVVGKEKCKRILIVCIVPKWGQGKTAQGKIATYYWVSVCFDYFLLKYFKYKLFLWLDPYVKITYPTTSEIIDVPYMLAKLSMISVFMSLSQDIIVFKSIMTFIYIVRASASE